MEQIRIKDLGNSRYEAELVDPFISVKAQLETAVQHANRLATELQGYKVAHEKLALENVELAKELAKCEKAYHQQGERADKLASECEVYLRRVRELESTNRLLGLEAEENLRKLGF